VILITAAALSLFLQGADKSTFGLSEAPHPLMIEHIHKPELASSGTTESLNRVLVPTSRNEVAHSIPIVSGELNCSVEVAVVREQDEEPAPKIEVLLLEAIDVRPFRSFTNREGKALFDHMRPGRKYVTSPWGGGVSIDLAPGQSFQLKLVLPVGRNISICAQDQLGAPVPQAAIHVTVSDSSDIESVIGETAIDGCTHLRGLSPRQKLWVTADGFVPSCRFSIHAIRGLGDGSIQFVLRRAQASIVGRVIDEMSSEAVPFAHVYVHNRHVDADECSSADCSLLGDKGPLLLTTDIRGEFSSSQVASLPATLAVEAEGFASKSFYVEELSGTSPKLSLGLQRGGKVFGRCVDESGSPVMNATVFAARLGDIPQKVTVTDEQGEFSLERLPFGKTTVTAVGAGGSRGDAEVELSGETPDSSIVTIIVSCQSCVEGMLQTSSGVPLGGWLIGASEGRPATCEGSQAVTLTTSTLPDGSFVINAGGIDDPWILGRPLQSEVGWPVFYIRAVQAQMGVITIMDSLLPECAVTFDVTGLGMYSSSAHTALVSIESAMQCIRQKGESGIVEFKGIPAGAYMLTMNDAQGIREVVSESFVLLPGSRESSYHVSLTAGRLGLASLTK
jgi:hypothetical protein